jgi:hypothetical protein
LPITIIRQIDTGEAAFLEIKGNFKKMGKYKLHYQPETIIQEENKDVLYGKY